MNDKIRQYPTVLQAIHLLVLYIFIQTVVDFPLAIIDYYKDSEWLYHPIKKILLGVGSVIFILWFGWRKTGNPIRAVFPTHAFNPLLFVFLITFFLGAHHLLNYVNAFVEWAVPPPAWFWELFDKIFDNDFGFWGALLKVVVVAPIIEELIFRGVVMHGLMRNYSKVTAIFFSGLLFALFHLNPWQFPATFVLGILLGWLMIRTNNILVCIGGHALNNLLVLISITYPQQMLEKPASVVSPGLLTVISVGLVIISILLLQLVTRRRNKKSDVPPSRNFFSRLRV